MRGNWIAALAAAALWGAPAAAQSVDAQRFGVREGVEQISLSPDGNRVVFISPGKGPETIAYVGEVVGGKPPLRLLVSDGNPESIRECRWSSNTRVVCQITMLLKEEVGLVGYSRMISANADGTDGKMLSPKASDRATGVAQGGGEIVDWLPDTDGDVLMTRVFIPEKSIGTLVSSDRKGYGIERVDTATLRRSIVESPRSEAVEYITDGHGVIRIMGTMGEASNYATGSVHYFYRTQGSREWQPLSIYDINTEDGFNPYAVDRCSASRSTDR